MGASPSVIRVWMPIILGGAVCLFLRHAPPLYWLSALILFPILIFMVTLAEVHGEGSHVCIRLLWKSIHIPRTDVLTSQLSFLDGIGVLRLRKPVFPWGRIFFVQRWSRTPPDVIKKSDSYDFLLSVVMAISGFAAARAANIRGLNIETAGMRILALVFITGLCLLFAVTRRKNPGLANFRVFSGAFLAGLLRW